MRKKKRKKHTKTITKIVDVYKRQSVIWCVPLTGIRWYCSHLIP